MAIVTSEKIFVDPKEEVITIRERIIKSERDKVILVVPQNSILLSSYVTVNILFREVARSSKIVVLVTEDDYGKSIAKKAGFEVVPKVSMVTSMEWDKSIIKKKDLLARLEERKRGLLENIQGDEAYNKNESIEDAKEEVVQEDLPQQLENNDPEVVVNPVEQVTQANLPAAENKSEEDIVKRFQKPRREPKIVTLDGIEILSGGDILNLENKDQYDKMDGLINKMPDNGQEGEEMENIQPRVSRNIQSRNLSGFTGKDFTKAVKKKVPFGGFFKFFGDKSRNLRDDVRQNTNKKRKKFLIIGLVALLFLFLTGGYVLAFQSSSVDITLQLKKEDISTSASIIVDSQADEISLDPLTIPGIKLTQENLSMSRTGEASGEGIRGNKATGPIDLINLTENEIVLNAGTKITSVSTNLIYVLKNNTTIPKGKKNSDGLVEAERLEDVAVEASEFGDKYNISGTDSNTIFSVEGYSRSSQLQATRYSDFTGGSSEKFVSVAEDNVKKIKEQIMPEIKKEGEVKLKLQVPTGYRYLPETLEFIEKEVKANPDIGQESKDKTFNLSVAGTATAIAVKNEDLEKAITEIIKRDKNKGDAVSVQGIEDLKIDKIEKSDNKLILTVSSKSSLQKTVTVDQIKSDVAGRSISDAKDYLNLLEEVQKYRISFNPDIVPESLRRVPSDLNRINIKTE